MVSTSDSYLWGSNLDPEVFVALSIQRNVTIVLELGYGHFPFRAFRPTIIFYAT